MNLFIIQQKKPTFSGIPQNVKSVSFIGKEVDHEKRINKTCGNSSSNWNSGIISIRHFKHCFLYGRSDCLINLEKVCWTANSVATCFAAFDGCFSKAFSLSLITEWYEWPCNVIHKVDLNCEGVSPSHPHRNLYIERRRKEIQMNNEDR